MQVAQQTSIIVSMLPLSIFVGKSVLFGLRLLGRKGSALPGLIVEKLNRNFLPSTLGQLPRGVIVVTGTNGKTTTTKVISDLLTSQGLRVLTNNTGSNFVRGIIATVAGNISLSGRLDYDIAVFEQDEAHAVRFVAIVKPKGVVALNVMRDQMDRFGEIDTTAAMIAKVASAATDWVVLNANDSRIAAVKDGAHPDKLVWFGHSEALLPSFITDDQHHNRDKLSYYSAAAADVELTAMKPGQVSIKAHGKTVDYVVRLDGSHNAINLAAAIATLQTSVPDYDESRVSTALKTLEPAFGRGERIALKSGAELRLQLVKNPAGFTHSLRLLQEVDYLRAGIVINDDYADGRDVSWLWDVDFTNLGQQPVSCGGTRAYDMAVRLKYDDVPTNLVTTNPADYLYDLTDGLKPGDSVILFATYTAMLRIREILKASGHKIAKVRV